MVHPIWSSVLVADQIFQIGKIIFSVNLDVFRFVNAPSTFLKVEFTADMIQGFAQRSASSKRHLNSQKQRSQMFLKTGVLKNFAIFAGKQLCWSIFLIKLQAQDLQLY